MSLSEKSDLMTKNTLYIVLAWTEMRGRLGHSPSILLPCSPKLLNAFSIGQTHYLRLVNTASLPLLSLLSQCRSVCRHFLPFAIIFLYPASVPPIDCFQNLFVFNFPVSFPFFPGSLSWKGFLSSLCLIVGISVGFH